MTIQESMDEIYQKLNKKADLLYEFVILYHNYIYTDHSYDSEHTFTMMEIHTLTHIEDHPGVTVTELAEIWQKTKSAVSQTVKKLVDSGYVEKMHKENNKKSIHLYVTETGARLSQTHKAYDVADITQTSNYLVSQCGQEDMDAFYRVLETYIKLLRDE